MYSARCSTAIGPVWGKAGAVFAEAFSLGLNGFGLTGGFADVDGPGVDGSVSPGSALHEGSSGLSGVVDSVSS